MQNGGMVRKKPCRICRRFFRPKAQVGDRQKTCGKDVCRKAWRKRKNQEAYRKGRDYHRGHALRNKLMSALPFPGRASSATTKFRNRPSGFLQFPREEMQATMGHEATVTQEYLATIVLRRAISCLRTPRPPSSNKYSRNTIKS